MSKAMGKRRRKRHQEFGQLAVSQPGLFMVRWQDRVASWAGEVRRHVLALNLDRANSVIEYSLEELRQCGPKAWELAAAETRRTLEEARKKAINLIVETQGLKEAWDKRIQDTCRKIHKYANSLHKPPVFQLASQVLQELRSYGENVWIALAKQLPSNLPQECINCGDNPWEQIAAYTKLELEAVCASAIAQIVNPNMYHFYNYTKNF